jgi:hypothetical protein
MENKMPLKHIQIRAYEKFEALGKIAYDEYHNGLIETFGHTDLYPTWDDLTPMLQELWVGVAQAVRVGVLRGVA